MNIGVKNAKNRFFLDKTISIVVSGVSWLYKT